MRFTNMILSWGAWLSLLLWASCSQAAPADPEQAAGPTWPEGTVLAVNGLAITAAEVDALCPSVRKLYPAFALPHRRRLVLTNLTLNQAAVRSRDALQWQLAKTSVFAEWTRLQLGAEPRSEMHTYSGSHVELGFGIWAHATLQEPGLWMGPYDVIGHWAIIRLDEYDHSTHRADVSVLEYNYIDPTLQYGATRHASMQAAHHSAQLTIVDPAWSEYVPMEWQYEMRTQQ